MWRWLRHNRCTLKVALVAGSQPQFAHPRRRGEQIAAAYAHATGREERPPPPAGVEWP
jgi:hypothetical protein